MLTDRRDVSVDQQRVDDHEWHIIDLERHRADHDVEFAHIELLELFHRDRVHEFEARDL